MRLLQYDSVDSTNAELKRLWQAGSLAETKSMTVLWAQEQTAGRGTRGRTWVSRKGAGLYFSILHQPTDTGTIPLAIPLTTDFTTVSAHACAQVFQDIYHLPVRVKPINDLVVCDEATDKKQNKKLGGILTESVMEGDVIKALITGVGINVEPLGALPDDNNPNPLLPISLFELLNTQQQKDFSPQACVEHLCIAIDQAYQQITL